MCGPQIRTRSSLEPARSAEEPALEELVDPQTSDLETWTPSITDLKTCPSQGSPRCPLGVFKDASGPGGTCLWGSLRLCCPHLFLSSDVITMATSPVCDIICSSSLTATQHNVLSALRAQAWSGLSCVGPPEVPLPPFNSTQPN